MLRSGRSLWSKRGSAVELALVLVTCLAVGCDRPGKRSDGSSASASAKVSAAAIPAPPAPPSVPAPEDVAAPPKDAQLTPGGVAMKRLKAGSGTVHPGPNDCVRVNHSTWKRNGSLHSSSSVRGQPSTQCLRGTMPGLVEALERMVVGEEQRIWVPGKLTYRSNDPDESAPKDDLTLDVELLELMKAPDAPADLKAPSRRAKKTASGLAFEVIKPGSGTVHPQSTNRMTVQFSAWTSDGVLFESTVMSGRPATLSHADVVVGLREGLTLMVVGEKARFWIPSALAFGDKPRRGAPAGNLVYDVELLAID